MLLKIGFQSLWSSDSVNVSVWAEFTRRRMSGHLSAVRRRRSLLSAPTSSTRRHAPSGCLRRAIHPSRAPHCVCLRPRRAPPRFGKLSRPLHRVSGQASLPKAPPRRPLPRRPLLSLSRAPVRPHCQLHRELQLAGLHRDHRQYRPLWSTSGRDSSSYSFALSRSCSSATSTVSPMPRFAGVTPRSTAAPPFTTASTLGSSRARVK